MMPLKPGKRPPAERVDFVVTGAGEIQIGQDYREGLARLQAEDARVEATKARARPPVECGPDMPVAPARGATIAFHPTEVQPDLDGNMRPVPMGYRGRTGARVAHGLDRMMIAARVRKAFTAAELNALEGFAQVRERALSAGVKCSSLERGSGSGGAASGVNEAVVDDLRRYARFLRAIGNRPALELRRIRPSAQSEGAAARRTIHDLKAMCMLAEGATFAEILKAHGWNTKGVNLKSLCTACRACLSRMAGI